MILTKDYNESMGKEVRASPEVSAVYADFVAPGEELKRVQERNERQRRLRKTFEQGVRLSKMYGGIEHRRYTSGSLSPGYSSYAMTLKTPPVTVVIEGKQVNFTIRATGGRQGSKWQDIPKSPQVIFPEDCYSVSVHPVEDNQLGTPLFNLRKYEHYYIELTTPLNGKNSSKEIEMVSDFIGAIGQSLSESHIPRPQQADQISREARVQENSLIDIYRRFRGMLGTKKDVFP